MMNWRRHFLEAATLIAAAVLCAVVSNAIAGRERKMLWSGTYPNAMTVPAATPAAATTTTVAPPVNATTTTTTGTTTGTGEAPILHGTTTTTTAPPKQPGNPAAQQPAQQLFPPHPDKPYIEIQYDAVKQLHDKGVLFLDARRTSVYEQGHIAGARPFSVWESDIDEKVNKLFEERGDPKQQAEPIVVYCSGGDCEDSHMLAQKLWGIQYNNVYVYKDGFPDWQKHGAAIHTGAAP